MTLNITIRFAKKKIKSGSTSEASTVMDAGKDTPLSFLIARKIAFFIFLFLIIFVSKKEVSLSASGLLFISVHPLYLHLIAE